MASSTTRAATAGSRAWAGRRPRLPWARAAAPRSRYAARNRRTWRTETPRSSAASAEITIPASRSLRTRRRCCSVWLKVTESSMGGQSHRTLRADVLSERPQADDRLLQPDKATTTIEVLRAGAPGAALTIGPPQPVAPPRRPGRGTYPPRPFRYGLPRVFHGRADRGPRRRRRAGGTYNRADWRGRSRLRRSGPTSYPHRYPHPDDTGRCQAARNYHSRVVIRMCAGT